MAKIQTVLGAIEDTDLGVTLCHEHIVSANGSDNVFYPWLYDRAKSLDWAIERMTEVKQGGVDAVIDMTPPDIGRDVVLVAEASQASGLHVVAATGFWRDPPRSVLGRDLDALADIFVHEIEQGIGNTAIRAGVIKVANDVEGITDRLERVMRAAARACKRTGCPISTHHNSSMRQGLAQIRIFQEEGAPMDRVCIGHSGDTTDLDYLESLLRAGVYLGMDRYPGRAPMAWEQRNAIVKTLIDRGWGDRLMLSHDAQIAAWVWAGREPPRGGASARYNSDGVLFVSRVAIPGFRKDGVSQDVIDLMMRETPRRFLSGVP